ncbi:MAG: DedA family protein [Gammaproteobacteria bacterium]|nr:MAG: DedA family protein [Gammaproteobacteria bacterium]RTZ62356.1 MAG: DedA family protein [Gammaproteobacteria bacterium]
MFGKLYEAVLRWAAHKQAVWYLGLLSFMEASFFPVPPDVMLAPMVLANRRKAWRYALVTTLASIAGAALGYVIGMFLYEELAKPIVQLYHLEARLETVKNLFADYGVWIIFVAGFSPIPYKLFTITAGLVNMAFIPFLVASFIGRGARFFLVAGLVYLGGEKMAHGLQRRIEYIGWGSVALVVFGIAGYQIWR